MFVVTEYQAIDQAIVNSTMKVVEGMAIAGLRIDSDPMQVGDAAPFGRIWTARVVVGSQQYGCSWGVLYHEAEQGRINLAALEAQRYLGDLKRTVEQLQVEA